MVGGGGAVTAMQFPRVKVGVGRRYQQQLKSFVYLFTKERLWKGSGVCRGGGGGSPP